jgi:hypothetical protein
MPLTRAMFSGTRLAVLDDPPHPSALDATSGCCSTVVAAAAARHPTMTMPTVSPTVRAWRKTMQAVNRRPTPGAAREATAQCSNSSSSSCSYKVHCSQVCCKPVHCTPGIPGTASSRLHCDMLRHRPSCCTQERCVQHNYSGTRAATHCAGRWRAAHQCAARCAAKACAGRGSHNEHAALRAGAQHAGAQVAALRWRRRGGAGICCWRLLLPPSLGRTNSIKTA